MATLGGYGGVPISNPAILEQLQRQQQQAAPKQDAPNPSYSPQQASQPAPSAPQQSYAPPPPQPPTSFSPTTGGTFSSGYTETTETTSPSGSGTGSSLPTGPTPGPTPSPAGTVSSKAPDTTSPALEGLAGAFQDVGGAGQPGAAPSPGMGTFGSELRPNLGNRLYPQESGALAALRRAY